MSPFHEYGKSDGQTVRFVVELDPKFTAKTNVAALSQAPATVKFAVCVSAPVKISPFQL